MIKWIFTFFFMFVAPAVSAENRTPLYVLSATDTRAITDLISAFERRYPEIKIVYREFHSNDLYNTIKLNKLDASFAADVVISSAMDLQVKLVNEGMAFSYESENSHLVPDWAKWRNELYGFTFEPVVIAYNKKIFGETFTPGSHAELAGYIRDQEARFLRRIGIYDIRKSGSGYLFASQDAIQSNQVFRLIESLGRARAKTYQSTSAILDGLENGELDLGYNLIGSYAIRRAQKNPDIGISVISDYSLVMARTAFIHKKAKHLREAENFIDFLLSEEGQQAISKSSALIPINRKYQAKLDEIKGKSPFLPIKLGVSLLTYQDTLKKGNFLKSWEASILWE